MRAKKEKKAAMRIRREYFDDIVTGDKTVEYRPDSPHWRKILKKDDMPEIAVFICGKDVHRRKILFVQKIPTPIWFSAQGQADVNTSKCFAIHLGEVADES